MTSRYVFLSYSRRDAAIAKRFEKALVDAGYAAFDPRHELQPGQDWRSTVRNAIKEADAFVLLLASPEAADQSWVGYETGMAEALGKKVLTLLPDRYSLAQLPADISAQQILSLDPARPEKAAREIANRLAAA